METKKKCYDWRIFNLLWKAYEIGFNIEKRASISDVSANIVTLDRLKSDALRKISNAYIDFQQIQASLCYPHSQEVGTQGTGTHKSSF